MDGEDLRTNRRQGPKTACLLRRTEDRAKTVSFETPNTVFTNLDPEYVLAGLAAGGVIALVAMAIMTHNSLLRRLFLGKLRRLNLPRCSSVATLSSS